MDSSDDNLLNKKRLNYGSTSGQDKETDMSGFEFESRGFRSSTPLDALDPEAHVPDSSDKKKPKKFCG